MFSELIKIKKSFEEKGISGLSLDIDEVLSWTVGHWMEEMQEKFGNPENLSIQEMIAKYRYSQYVPYWQMEEAKKWMKEKRDCNEFQQKISLVKDSNHITQEINKIIPIVAYITIRPQSVVDGTKKWLDKHGFPEAEIIARPPEVRHAEGNKWKAEVLDFLYPQIIGIIDDNPALIDFLPAGYKGCVYLYDNKECVRNDIDVVPCETWDSVLKAVEERYS